MKIRLRAQEVAPMLACFAQDVQVFENRSSLFIEPMTEKPLDSKNKSEYPEKTKKVNK